MPRYRWPAPLLTVFGWLGEKCGLALHGAGRLDADMVHQVAQLLGDVGDPHAPTLHRLAAARELRVVAAAEAALDGVVAREQSLPRRHVPRVDVLHVLRTGRVGPDLLEVGERTRPVVGDLAAHLRLVHELGAEDPLDRALGFRLDGPPGPHAGEVRLHVGADGARWTAAAERQPAEREDPSEAAQPTPRNRRTPRRNPSSWSWCTQ